MKISRGSWHYRLLRRLTKPDELVNGDLPHKSCCGYFLDLASMLLIVLPISAVAIVILTPVILPVVLLDEWLNREKQDGQADGEPRTVFGKWLKAKKDKVCPPIEWVD